MANALGDTVDKLKDYVEIKAEQIKLNVLSHVAKFSSAAIALSTVLLLAFFLLFFLSFGLANFLNSTLESLHLGYFLVAGIYFILIVILLLLMKTGVIQKWIEFLISNSAYHDDEEDD